MFASAIPSPPPWQPQACSLCLSRFLFCSQVYLCHTLDSKYKWHLTWYLSFSFWITSLNVIISRSIHAATNGIISFFFYAWVVCHCIYVPHLLYPFLCLRAFRLFPCLAIVNTAAMNIGVHVSLWVRFIWIYAQEWNCWIIW